MNLLFRISFALLGTEIVFRHSSDSVKSPYLDCRSSKSVEGYFGVVNFLFMSEDFNEAMDQTKGSGKNFIDSPGPFYLILNPFKSNLRL